MHGGEDLSGARGREDCRGGCGDDGLGCEEIGRDRGDSDGDGDGEGLRWGLDAAVT